MRELPYTIWSEAPLGDVFGSPEVHAGYVQVTGQLSRAALGPRLARLPGKGISFDAWQGGDADGCASWHSYRRGGRYLIHESNPAHEILLPLSFLWTMTRAFPEMTARDLLDAIAPPVPLVHAAEGVGDNVREEG